MGGLRGWDRYGARGAAGQSLRRSQERSRRKVRARWKEQVTMGAARPRKATRIDRLRLSGEFGEGAGRVNRAVRAPASVATIEAWKTPGAGNRKSIGSQDWRQRESRVLPGRPLGWPEQSVRNMLSTNPAYRPLPPCPSAMLSLSLRPVRNQKISDGTTSPLRIT